MRRSTAPARVLLWKGWALLAVSLLLPGATATASSPSLLRRLQDASPSMGNIISTDPDLTTLAATLDMLTASGALADMLLSNGSGSDGGITLLAPTNTAFAAIADTTVGERVLTTGSGYAHHLENLLALHFFPGTVLSADLITSETGTAWTTANGETVTVGDGPSFAGPANDADAPARLVTVTKDLLAANGVVHKIDTVLLPEFWNVDVVTFAETSSIESLSTVKALLSTVQQQNPSSAFLLRLAKRSEVTLFAPTNEAFDEQGLLDAIEQQVSSGDDTSLLFNIIQNHVVLGTVLPMSRLVDGYEVSTMRNGPLKVETLEGEKVLVGGSLILDFILANNGMIYTTQTALLSESDKAQLYPPSAVSADSLPAPQQVVAPVAPPPTTKAPVAVAPITRAPAPVFIAPTKPTTKAPVAPAPVVLVAQTKPATKAPVADAPVPAPTKPTTKAPIVETTAKPTAKAPVPAVPVPAPTTKAPAPIIKPSTRAPVAVEVAPIKQSTTAPVAAVVVAPTTEAPTRRPVVARTTMNSTIAALPGKEDRPIQVISDAPSTVPTAAAADIPRNNTTRPPDDDRSSSDAPSTAPTAAAADIPRNNTTRPPDDDTSTSDAPSTAPTGAAASPRNNTTRPPDDDTSGSAIVAASKSAAAFTSTSPWWVTVGFGFPTAVLLLNMT